MDYLYFGVSNLKPSKLGCGCSHIASLSTRHSRKEVQSTLLEAFDQGINFFDTADIYGQGDSERLLGKLFKNQRDKVIFCTKAGLTLRLSQSLIRLAKPVLQPVIRKWKSVRKQANAARKQAEKNCFEPKYLANQIEGSLRRLQTDYVDLFLLHSPSSAISQDESIFAMLDTLKSQGKILHYGVSCASADDAMVYLSKKRLFYLQVPANLMRPDVLNKVLPTARKKDCIVISREPFEGGRIFNSPKLKEFCAKQLNRPPAQVALGYLLQRNDTGIVLTGMTCRKNLYNNLNTLASSPLTKEEIQQLEKLKLSVSLG